MLNAIVDVHFGQNIVYQPHAQSLHHGQRNEKGKNGKDNGYQRNVNAANLETEEQFLNAAQKQISRNAP